MSVRVRVTHRIAARYRPHVKNKGAELHADALRVLLRHLQTVACGAAQLAWAGHPASVEWMEGQTGRKGWRAYLDEDAAALIGMLEDEGIARFVLEEGDT